jgi:hypothetical protein
MTYENYLFVSWTDGTPLTGTRLAQMSTNIEQVKDVIDDKATGVIKMVEYTSAIGTFSDFTEHEVGYLRDESSSGGVDRRISIGANRYYRMSVNIPSISVTLAGGEDCKYVINAYQGANVADTGKLLLGSWEVTPAPFTFINLAGGVANLSNVAIKSVSYPSKLGAGSYSVLKSTTTALVNQNFFVSVTRSQGASTANPTTWRVDASATSPIQIYVEDVGGV